MSKMQKDIKISVPNQRAIEGNTQLMKDATSRRPLCLPTRQPEDHNEGSVRASWPRHGGINSSSQRSLEKARTKTDPKAVGIPTKILSIKK